MLRKLELNNFKKHKHLEVEFTPGLNGIFGSNYKGKTTILYGVMYCLGGSSVVPGKNLMSRGESSGFKQTLLFSCAGEDYFVERTKSSAKLFQGSDDSGQPLATGTTAVNQHIEKLLGMPLKLFKELRYGEQKKTDAILTFGPTKLHKILEQLTGVEDVNSAIIKLSDIISKEGTVVEELSYEDPESVKKELDNNITVRNSSLESIKSLQDLIDCKDAEIEGFQAQLKDIRDIKAEYATKSKRLKDIESEKAAVSSHLEDLKAKLKELTDDGEASSEIEVRYEDILTRRDLLKSSLKVVEVEGSELEDLDRKIRSTESMIASYSNDIEMMQEPTQEELQFVEDSITDSSAQLVMIREKIKRAEELGGADTCPKCGQSVHEMLEAESLELLKEQDAEWVSSIKTLKEQKASMEFVKGQLQELNSKKESAMEKLGSLCERKEALEEKVSTAEDYIENNCSLKEAEIDLKEVRQQLDEARANEKWAETLGPEIEECGNKLTNLVEEAESIEVPEYDEKQEAMVIEVIQDLTEKRREFESSLSEVSKAEASAKASITHLQYRYDKILETNERYTKAQSRHNTASELQKFLRSNRDQYMGDAWATFMASATEFANSCTNGAIEQVSRSEDGEFTYCEEGYEMSMKEASGAQRSVMGLGVQVALSESYECPLDILMVDEPAADMDAEHSIATSMMLSSKGKQVIMISHSQMDNSVCENVIML